MLKTSTIQESDILPSIWNGIREQVEELGLSLTVWDATGRMVGLRKYSCDFCEMVCKSGGGCEKTARDIARYVLDNRETSRCTSPIGCCQFGLPVFDRRRLAGAVVLCYPTREMLDDEYLARLCDRLKLDRKVMLTYARTSCRHSATEAVPLQNMFSHLLGERSQACETTEALNSLSVNLTSTYEALSMLYRISGSMTVSQQPRPFLQSVCDQLLNVMDLGVAAALVYDERTKLDDDIVIKSATNEKVTAEQLRFLTATYLVSHLPKDESFVLDNSFENREYGFVGRNIKNLLAVPLIIDRQNVGVLIAANKQQGEFDSFDTKFLTSIAAQASVFLTNNRMYGELQEMLMGVLYSLTESIDAKDPYTCGHSRRVAAIARRMAMELGSKPQIVRQVYLAGLLHDIGKIGIPEAILCKEGKLTNAEYEIMKKHPAIGAKILSRIRHLEPIIAGVLCHHERMDGKGYPHGWSGMDIPIEGRILGLADSWDAMTSCRTYRSALSVAEAKQEIRRCAGGQFDPKLAKIFLSWDLDAFMKELYSPNAEENNRIEWNV